MDNSESLKELFRHFHSDGLHNISDLTDVEEILDIVGAQYKVALCRLMMATLEGEPWEDADNSHIYFDNPTQTEIRPSAFPGLPESYRCQPGDSRGVVRINPDGSVIPFGVVGSQYGVVQNAHIVTDALKLIEISEGEVLGLSHAGTYDEGRKFYVASQAKSLTIDIGAYSETFHRSVEYGTSHDSELSFYTLFSFSDPHTGLVIEHVRVKRRHSRKVIDAVQSSQETLKNLQKISDEIVSDVTQLSQIQLPLDSDTFKKLLEICTIACTKRIKNLTTEEEQMRRVQIADSIKKAFSSSHRDKRGSNGWALYTAYLEIDDQTIKEVLARKRSSTSLHENATSSSSYGQLRQDTRHALLGIAKR